MRRGLESPAAERGGSLRRVRLSPSRGTLQSWRGSGRRPATQSPGSTTTATAGRVTLFLAGTRRSASRSIRRTRDTVYVGPARERHPQDDATPARTWDECELPEPGVFSLAVAPPTARVYAGTEPSRLFRSDDGGDTWRELTTLLELPSRPTWSFPPRPWTSHVRWIAPSPHDADLLLVGIELGGLMRSTDGGETWDDHRPGAQRDVHSLAWHPHARGRAYEAGGGGSAWSDDAGDTWHPADDGRDRNYTWSVAVDPGGSRLLVRLREHRPVRRARRPRSAGAHLPAARRRAVAGARRRPPRAAARDAVRARRTTGRLFAGLADGTALAERRPRRHVARLHAPRRRAAGAERARTRIGVTSL